MPRNFDGLGIGLFQMMTTTKAIPLTTGVPLRGSVDTIATSKDEAWVKENLVARIASGNWTLERNYDFRKTGLTPTPPPGQVGSEMLLEFQNLKKSVGKVLVSYMQSYGIQLKDSNVRVKILQLAHAAASGDDDSFREAGAERI
jgi:hypothetical protein